jgi:hypothetical protein
VCCRFRSSARANPPGANPDADPKFLRARMRTYVRAWMLQKGGHFWQNRCIRILQGGGPFLLSFSDTLPLLQASFRSLSLLPFSSLSPNPLICPVLPKLFHVLHILHTAPSCPSYLSLPGLPLPLALPNKLPDNFPPGTCSSCTAFPISTLQCATPPEGSPAVAHAMKAPAISTKFTPPPSPGEPPYGTRPRCSSPPPRPAHPGRLYPPGWWRPPSLARRSGPDPQGLALARHPWLHLSGPVGVPYVRALAPPWRAAARGCCCSGRCCRQHRCWGRGAHRRRCGGCCGTGCW